MRGAQPLKYPLRRVALLLQQAFILFQNAIDDLNEYLRLSPEAADYQVVTKQIARVEEQLQAEG